MTVVSYEPSVHTSKCATMVGELKDWVSEPSGSRKVDYLGVLERELGRLGLLRDIHASPSFNTLPGLPQPRNSFVLTIVIVIDACHVHTPHHAHRRLPVRQTTSNVSRSLPVPR